MKKNKLNNILTTILAALLLLNLGVMVTYTAITNSKLNEAINLTKPQEAELTIIIAENCPECKTLDALRKYIEEQNIELTSTKSFTADSETGKDLIEEHKIERLPAMIFKTDGSLKSTLKKALEKGSKSISEDTIVWEQLGAPYFDLKKSEIAGLVTVTFISDKSCATCYDVEAIHKGVLANFGVKIVNQQTFDMSEEEGHKLIEKYQITKVPTVILSKEVDAYESLKTAWAQAGTVEADGNYIFREMSLINAIFKDLETNKVNQP